MENNAVLSFFPNIQIEKKNDKLETYRPFVRNGVAECKRMKTSFCAMARTSGACCSSLLHSTKFNLLITNFSLPCLVLSYILIT